MGKYTALQKCRVSASKTLIPILDLGEQALTGVFPRDPAAPITTGPLRLVWCPDSGLVQLDHSYDLGEMYGENYGYRSGLNQSMVRHLTQKIRNLERLAGLAPHDTVLDIGSNDATSLKAYQTPSLNRIGIDPTGAKFRAYYDDDITLVPDFFSAAAFRATGAKPAKIVTSIAMFYDLEDPISFAREIEAVLAPGGVWHFEQSYMPAMLRTTSYDTICHEHLEYYSLGVVVHILAAVGMRVFDVKMNAVNGGSFAVTAVRHDDPREGSRAVIDWLLGQEERMGLNTPRPYREFEDRVFRHRADLQRLLRTLAADGKTVLGYGASTKGNVLLQFCGITTAEMAAIAEVNPDKFGAFTPGTAIPIISEAEARAMQPDYFLVLPWHFKEGIIQREAEFLAGGGHMIFPFPDIEII
ncbi:MAG TPA: class I SAM-dependent methyltransferase [Acidiphilium sp.]|nr:MAG: methyltransferase [Acidiphilium sp. 21-60-14]OYV89945.1 MAG: methyltransferase [Acidiphilium sp. 37-60-79]OZB40815.1 MAG: methyltransferase [Acidiphilium sp. 34-60-192]HQT88507.1 class I SAM-dependent methyltransferase [Acidiphilium sp.]HQU23841.1 class I SAM-dependent methyltransferase [Acidiphilium sp.]